MSDIQPSCYVNDKDGVSFRNFDPYNDKLATCAMLRAEKERIQRSPGSKLRYKQIRTIESAMLSFGCTDDSAPVKPDTRAGKRHRSQMRQLRRKAIRYDSARKFPVADKSAR